MHTDAALITQHLSGAPRAFERLVARHRPVLMGFLRSRVGDDAEELHQELWVRVARNLATYQHDGRFRAFLFTSARRLVIDRHRRTQTRPKVVHLDHARALRAGRPSPIGDLAHAELQAALTRALADMDPETAQVLRWRLHDNLPFREIADRQQTSINTALSRAHRGLKRLRVELAGHAEPVEAIHG
jgi:RNA polymerase sigma-70 factor (ECF subfamily)